MKNTNIANWITSDTFYNSKFFFLTNPRWLLEHSGCTKFLTQVNLNNDFTKWHFFHWEPDNIVEIIMQGIEKSSWEKCSNLRLGIRLHIITPENKPWLGVQYSSFNIKSSPRKQVEGKRASTKFPFYRILSFTSVHSYLLPIALALRFIHTEENETFLLSLSFIAGSFRNSLFIDLGWPWNLGTEPCHFYDK